MSKASIRGSTESSVVIGFPSASSSTVEDMDFWYLWNEYKAIPMSG